MLIYEVAKQRHGCGNYSVAATTATAASNSSKEMSSNRHGNAMHRSCKCNSNNNLFCVFCAGCRYFSNFMFLLLLLLPFVLRQATESTPFVACWTLAENMLHAAVCPVIQVRQYSRLETLAATTTAATATTTGPRADECTDKHTNSTRVITTTMHSCEQEVAGS